MNHRKPTNPTALADKRRARRIRAGQTEIGVPVALLRRLIGQARPHRTALVAAFGEATTDALLDPRRRPSGRPRRVTTEDQAA